MDAQRTRRTRDQARKTWYAHYRQIRFARWFGFIDTDTDLDALLQRRVTQSHPRGSALESIHGLATRPASILDEVLHSAP